MDPMIQQKIFAGESGGDYDALFGFSNRPGSRYENVKLTDMTINEADQFADPSGEYGQWVKSQVGRVATPMGAYQIVGTTLRDAKRALGLTGDERMTPELQDRLGEYILQTQGTGAWEGYGKGGPVVSSQGGGDMDPQAFLEGFDEMLKPSPRAKAGQALQNFGALTTAFGRNEAAPAILPGDRMMARHEAKQGRNQTAAWLKSQGHNDMANAVLGGQMTGGDALKMIYARQAAASKGGNHFATAGDGVIFDRRDGTIVNAQPVDPNAPLDPEILKVADPIVKQYAKQIAPFEEARDVGNRVFTAYEHAKTAKTGAADLALITNYAKLLDPGSVVRESEAQMVANARGLLDSLGNYTETLAAGKLLTNDQRNEIASMSQALVDPLIKKGGAIHERFSTVWDQYGLPPELLPGLGEVQTFNPNTTPAGSGAPAFND